MSLSIQHFWRQWRQWLPGSLVLAACLLPPAFAAADPALIPHIAEYKIKVKILSGNLYTEVKRTPDGFSAQSVLKAAGFARLFVRGDVTERAMFRMSDTGVLPMTYSSSDGISKEDKEMAFNFDWERRHVSGSINEQQIEMDLEDRVYDRVSIQYELMFDLLNKRESSEYALLDDDKLKRLQISNIGSKQIKVPFGTFDAIGIQHKTENSDRITTLWCVEKLGFLPVIIEQHRDGKLVVRAELTDYRPTET